MSVVGKLGAGVVMRLLGFSIPAIVIILLLWAMLD
jgi:hypothetical protein